MDNADLKVLVPSRKLTPKFQQISNEYALTPGSDVKKIKANPLTSDSGASYSISVSLLLVSRLHAITFNVNSFVKRILISRK